MQVDLHCPHEFSFELGVLHPGKEREQVAWAPVCHEVITPNLAELVEEVYVRGILADHLDPRADSLSVSIHPVWSVEPLVHRIRIEVRTNHGPAVGTHSVEFAQGRWSRKVEATARQLRSDGVVGEAEQMYERVLAVNGSSGPTLKLPPLQAPEVSDQSLADLGVRHVQEGSFDPDRPVLINQRAIEEILELTIQCGPEETGGGMLGKIIRLPEPLDGARTRIVTVLTTGIFDTRHAGSVGRLAFSPQALVDAAQIAETRDLGEDVLTAFHSHGWGTGCDNCNEHSTCALPECVSLSLDDYQVLESLFPSKATLLPVAGRKLGAPGKRPVLAIHAWSGGTMKPVAWRTYEA